MSRTRRRALEIECMEEKVLLSAGFHDPARHILARRPRHINTNGVLRGSLVGSASLNGFTATSFTVVGRMGSLGLARGSFALADPFIPVGGRLNLSGSTLTLIGPKGAIELGIAGSTSNVYRYKIVAGSGHFSDVASAGMLVIKPVHGTNEYAMRLQTHG